MPEVYQHNILIAPQYLTETGVPEKDQPGELGPAFVSGVREALDRAKANSHAFAKLLTEINQSSHTVTIYMARSKHNPVQWTHHAQAETNATADGLQQKLLERVEGVQYAKSRAEILGALGEAFKGTKLRAEFDLTVKRGLRTLDWEIEGKRKIQELIAGDPARRQSFDQFLAGAIQNTKSLPKTPGKDDEVFDDRERLIPKGAVDPRLECEVFTAEGVYTPVNYYRPLWERIGDKLAPGTRA